MNGLSPFMSLKGEASSNYLRCFITSVLHLHSACQLFHDQSVYIVAFNGLRLSYLPLCYLLHGFQHFNRFIFSK